MRKVAWILIVTLIPLSLTYGSKKKKAYELIYQDVQVLKQQLVNLEKKVDANSKQIVQIYEMVRSLIEQLRTLQRSQADLNQNSEAFVAQLQAITEKLDETNRQLIRAYEELLSLKGSSSEITGESEGEESQPLEQTTSSQPIEETRQRIPTEFSPLSSPQQIYNTAYSDYLKGNYQLAIDGFKLYIEQFRESPLADNAQYWVGECYYSQENYTQAIEEFNRLILNFPQGDKVPAAYLKKAYSFLALGEKEEGITVLKLLLSKFPFSEEAKLAEQKIREVT
ncbi:MAG: tol-pal system protein YbgF [Candidatus Aminicenantia bacterium]